MRDEIKKLVNAISDETGYLNDLKEAMQDQREAMKLRDEDYIKDLMDEIQEIFFNVQTCDNLRSDLAKKLAAKFSCGPKVSELARIMTDDERKIFNGAADVLAQSVFALKSEMIILSGLIDQNEKYTSMLLSECQRIGGLGKNILQSGSTDFRG